MRWILKVALLYFALGTSCAIGQGKEKFEALFIYKFCDYVKWPTDNMTKVVGVYGNPEVVMELKKISASSEKISVRSLNDLKEASDCDIVYVSESQRSVLTNIRSVAQANNVLVVSENDATVSQGACIGFYTENGRLKFAMREPTVDAYALKVSGTLASLAKIVK